ncbi:MAG: 30S ribosomal protein S1 [Candidatus Dependentiae bacterium]|nr:30S ribosomal protein S1 [Candidatus Dependentiae bacterium]
MSKEFIKPKQFAKANAVQIEQDFTLSAEQLKDMQDLYEGTVGKFSTGQLITGKVLEVDQSGVLIDIDYKSNGFVPAYEFPEHELKALKAGSDIEVMIDEIENVNGDVVLSYEQAKAVKAWDRIAKLQEAGLPVEGMVLHKVKGGLSVDVGIPAFLPGSQVDLHRVTDFDQYVGQMVTAEIIKINKKRGNIIISRRKFLAERRDESRKVVLGNLEVGKIIQGVVKNITNYGVFIDVGGVDGLLHITDMTWGRISHPSEIVRIGQTISVKVLSIDKENFKVSLGMKQMDKNPWQGLDASIQIGSRVKGKVASITDYGVFVEVQKGVEGLIHISEISWTDRISNLQDRFAVGQEVEALVVSLDVDNRRMSLSIKQLEKNPWTAVSEDFKAGQTIKGVISNVTDFGIFVQLMPGVDGLVHVSDLSWTEHIEHPGDLYKRGDKVEAVILSIDEDSKKVALGIKQLKQDPWKTVETDYPVESIVKGIVTKITNYGAFVKLPTGIEGLIYNSELVEQKDEPVKPGQERELRVINASAEERKLGLSLSLEAKKEVKKEREEAPVAATSASAAAPKKKVAPKKEAAKATSSSSSDSSKAKSAFQLELERHMAGVQEEASEKKETKAKKASKE